jgi:hypothetical protein
MNNINTVINRVKIENDKSKNFTERLMRKKTTNMAKNYISIKPQEVHLDANEILKITLKKQQEYKEKLIEDEKNATKDNQIKELKYEVEILEQNEVELKNQLEVLLNNENETKIQMEINVKKEDELKIQQEIQEKKEQELKKQIDIQKKKEFEFKKQIEARDKKEYELNKQLERQLKKEEEIIQMFEKQIEKLQYEKQLFLLNKPDEVEQQLINTDTNTNSLSCKKPVVFKVVNVFQPVFMYNRKATGWGDIIRGSYFLIQYCEELELDFDIDMSYHPISRFLEKYRKNKYYNEFFIDKETENMKKNIYKNVVKFDETNFIPKVTSNKIILSNHRSIKEIKYKFNKYLNNVPFNCDIMESSIYTYTNENKSKLSNTKYIHTITFPIYNITYLQKERMKQEVEPCEEVKIEVQTIMNKLELVEERYVVLHIRCGDTYLLNKSKYFSKRFLSKVIEEVKSWLVFLENTRGTVINMNMNTTEEDTLKMSVFCIADNNYIKQILINEFPFIKILMFDIKHTGEGQHLEEENVKNTVIEFSIMSKSKSIFTISAYDHGSGFSKWCAETYSIPYMCKYIPNDV